MIADMKGYRRTVVIGLMQKSVGMIMGLRAADANCRCIEISSRTWGQDVSATIRITAVGGGVAPWEPW